MTPEGGGASGAIDTSHELLLGVIDQFEALPAEARSEVIGFVVAVFGDHAVLVVYSIERRRVLLRGGVGGGGGARRAGAEDEDHRHDDRTEETEAVGGSQYRERRGAWHGVGSSQVGATMGM